VIIAGASPGETKMWAAVREKGDFFALAVRITGKLLKIDGYMLREVWQAMNCISIRATYCVIVAEAFPGETKMWAAMRRNGIARPLCISWASCSLRYGDILFFFQNSGRPPSWNNCFLPYEITHEVSVGISCQFDTQI